MLIWLRCIGNFPDSEFFKKLKFYILKHLVYLTCSFMKCLFGWCYESFFNNVLKSLKQANNWKIWWHMVPNFRVSPTVCWRNVYNYFSCKFRWINFYCTKFNVVYNIYPIFIPWSWSRIFISKWLMVKCTIVYKIAKYRFLSKATVNKIK